jgi:hypothetical protein
MARYQLESTHPEDLACGAVIAPGEVTSKANPKNAHDKNLIDEGKLIELPAKSRKKEQ